jgi:chromosomal replication initiation ATPase DnaA
MKNTEFKREDLAKAERLTERAAIDLTNLLGVEVKVCYVIQNKTTEQLNVDMLLKITALTCKISIEDIFRIRKNKPELMYSRFIAVKIMWEVLNIPYYYIGLYVNRNHSTCMRTVDTFNSLYTTDRTFREYYDQVLFKFMQVVK